MKLKFLIFTIVLSYTACAQEAWINEIHYDNAGVDINEFIEVVAENSTDSLKLFLYNGLNGMPYDSVLLDTLSWQQIDPLFKISVWFKAGIQNGSPDGIVLIQDETILSAISYEGSFVGNGGPAVGIVFQDTEIFESGVLPPEYSMQKAGHGSKSAHFWWHISNPASPGELNSGQALTTQPIMFLSSTDTLSFGEVPFGSHSEPKNFVFYAANISEPVTIYIPFGYEISSEISFNMIHSTVNPLIIYPQEDFISPYTIHVRFCPPTGDGQKYTGSVILEHIQAGNFSVPVTGREGIPSIPNGWINEFHYDNTGTDTLEFIEVIIQYPERYLSEKIMLSLYNGSNLQTYKTFGLSEAMPGFRDDLGFQFYSFLIPGIQNGPDAILLSYGEAILHFISYEGPFTPVDGPAAGIPAFQILPYEDGETPPLSSIQFYGTGDTKYEFEWVFVPGNHTMGLPNIEQILPVKLLGTQFKKNPLSLSWQTTNDELLAGFIVDLSFDGNEFDSVAFIEPILTHGLYNSYHYYLSEPDQSIYKYIRIRSIDLGGEQGTLLVQKIPDEQDYSIRITWDQNKSEIFLPEYWIGTEFEASLFNLQGTLLRRLYDIANERVITLDHWIDQLPPGVYFLKIENREDTYFVRLIRN